MKKLYTAAEIAQRRLSGLPTTKSSILARAAKEGWRYEEQYGIGGIRKVFEVPDRYLLSDKRIRQSVLSARQDLEKYFVDDSAPRNDPAVHLDESKLALAARIVEEWLEAESLALSHEKKGSLIALLYKIVARNPDPEDLLKLMRGAVSAVKDEENDQGGKNPGGSESQGEDGKEGGGIK
ncbi:hypothetical protein LJC19_01690 [Oxalobacter sp. OttesenSCG-928-P03]|nr:hypothetical protein [Oxalobacter sp. OttesenSCG-928-P03]